MEVCRMKAIASLAVCLLAACITPRSESRSAPSVEPHSAPSVEPRSAPLVDYHEHLVSPAFAPVAKLPPRDGAALLRELDAAGIERAVVLSVVYSFADERK